MLPFWLSVLFKFLSFSFSLFLFWKRLNGFESFLLSLLPNKLKLFDRLVGLLLLLPNKSILLFCPNSETSSFLFISFFSLLTSFIGFFWKGLLEFKFELNILKPVPDVPLLLSWLELKSCGELRNNEFWAWFLSSEFPNILAKGLLLIFN